MSDRSPDMRRADALLQSVIQVVSGHRVRFFSEPSAERFRIYISVEDAQMLSDLAPRGGDFFVVKTIRDGDTGTLFGLPFTADASVRPGRVFIGYRVDALEVKP